MNQRIYDQLDALQRGARVTSPRRDAHDNSSAEYSAYDGHHCRQQEKDGFRDAYLQREEELIHQPLTLDSFEQQLLRLPNHESRQRQAVLGGARPTLAPAQRYVHQPHAPRAVRGTPTARPFDLSQFAFESGQAEPASSSPFNHPLPSSPAFHASRRRPAATGYGRDTRPHGNARAPFQVNQSSAYQSHSLEELEAEELNMQASHLERMESFQPSYASHQFQPPRRRARNDPPVVQGISLISTNDLPDRFRSIFPFPLFNAVQSKCFGVVYNTNDNFVLSSPTGSGKTAVVELAICRLVSGGTNGSFKIIYQAPTKSLCSERQRDWQAKFAPFDLQCAELTGDTEGAQLRNVQHATIIITTPEKWDSMTRKWKDHQKLMQMVKLFLIDEVHILKEDRGATLEAVVSRMKSIGSSVRFIALSATVPNSQDIATWLGKDPVSPHIPAPRERFGEEFRPVRLQKHVCGYHANSNDFAFEKTLNAKLTDVITQWSQRKPVMVFCSTRGACLETAKLLSNWWVTKGPEERYWESPHKRINIADQDLKETVSSGVAFHHAGLSIPDRNAVEKGYLEGDINVICCTSTLAVGINLPCHMVIIKNTITFQSNAAGGCKEYSDLEIMQMLGRAGRPQFDDSAVAVIMTRLHKVQYYEKMLTGQELLESCLHRNLIDHLNAEISLNTITSPSSAKKWLSGTFLYVRLKNHPEHYKLEGDAPSRNLDERLENICNEGIKLLQENGLVQATPKLQCTEFGDAMARYYLQFETMKTFLALPPKAKLSEVLSAISQAAEFRSIRFRAGEKNVYKDLNKNSSIKFPIPVNLDAPAHKVSLIIQSVLGAVDLPTEDYKQRLEYNTAKATIFQHVHRLIRCIVDCQLCLDDAVTARIALVLARSLGAQVWDDSPLHMKQLDGVGLVSVRKLAAAGIKTIEDLENAEAHRIERILTRNPPYGAQLQEKARTFPKLRVSMKVMGEPVIKKGEHVTVKIKAEIGFLNDKVPEIFQRKPVYVCLLAETSDGHKVYFARISAKKLNKGQDLLFSANLVSPNQSIRAYVMCDEIAGTQRHATHKPEIPPGAFPPLKSGAETNQPRRLVTHTPNTSKPRSTADQSRTQANDASEEFGDAGIDDADLARIDDGGFLNIDEFDEGDTDRDKAKGEKRKISNIVQTERHREPRQLENGKWACNHACKDKTACKHLCCREGLDKKAKPRKSKAVKDDEKQTETSSDPKQTQLNMPVAKKAAPSNPAALSVTKPPPAPQTKAASSLEIRDLNRLHNSTKSKTPAVPSLSKHRFGSDAGYSTTKGGQLSLSFLQSAPAANEEGGSIDYGGLDSNDLPDPDLVFGMQPATRMSPPAMTHGPMEDGGEMLDDEYDGFDELQLSRPLSKGRGDGHVDLLPYTSDFNANDIEGWQISVPNNTGFGPHTIPNSNEPLFAQSSEEMLEHEAQLSRSAGTKRTLNDDAAVSSQLFAPAKKQKHSRLTPSAQLLQELDQNVQPFLLENDNLNKLTEQVESTSTGNDKAASPDSIERWFKEEFGTEHFNYIG